MAKRAGSLWVEGGFLRYVDKNGLEWTTEGLNIATIPSAISGSMWTSDDILHYIDSNHNHRTITGIVVASRPAAKDGSLWVDTSGSDQSLVLHFTDGGVEYQIQADGSVTP